MTLETIIVQFGYPALIIGLREKQWAELVEMQQEQIRLLTKLLEEKSK